MSEQQPCGHLSGKMVSLQLVQGTFLRWNVHWSSSLEEEEKIPRQNFWDGCKISTDNFGAIYNTFPSIIPHMQDFVDRVWKKWQYYYPWIVNIIFVCVGYVCVFNLYFFSPYESKEIKTVFPFHHLWNEESDLCSMETKIIWK